MKKRKIMIAAAISVAIIAVVLIIVFSQSKPSSDIQQEGPTASPTQTAATPSESPSAEPTASAEPTKQQEPLEVDEDSYNHVTGWVDGVVENYKEVIEENEESDLTKEIEIPLYDDRELLEGWRDGMGYANYICFTPGLDSGTFRHSSVSTSHLTEELLAIFPSNAWRDMGDGRKYLMYDTDKGARVFLFFDDSNDYFHYLGFPVIMTEKLSYADMKEIKLGDTMDDVIAIDSSAHYIKDCLNYAADTWIKRMKELGCPTTTVHLLTDGVMKITYERTGEKDNYVYTITDIEYHQNFDINCIEGTFNYKIAEIDYVDN